MENINKKRKHTDELDDLFASSNEELVNTEGRTDIPELDHVIAAKYPGIYDVHRRFYALVNTFAYVYCITMNFEKLIANKKKDSKPVHMLSPYRALNVGKLTQAKIEPDFVNDRAYHRDVIRPGVKLTQFAYNKRVYDRINQVNTAAAMEFKTCMGMLKIPDCLKFVVRHGGHYHMVLLSNTSIYSRNAYKKAIGETYPRRVASSKRNTKAAGQLDVFLHIMYLLSGNKQVMGFVGGKDDQIK